MSVMTMEHTEADLFDALDRITEADPVSNWLGKCFRCKGVMVVASSSKPEYSEHICPECEKGMSFTRIRGRVTDKKCDANCRRGKKATCRCACGGSNHGVDWMR